VITADRPRGSTDSVLRDLSQPKAPGVLPGTSGTSASRPGSMPSSMPVSLPGLKPNAQKGVRESFGAGLLEHWTVR